MRHYLVEFRSAEISSRSWERLVSQRWAQRSQRWPKINCPVTQRWLRCRQRTHRKKSPLSSKNRLFVFVRAYKMAAPSLVFNGEKNENNVLESYYIVANGCHRQCQTVIVFDLIKRIPVRNRRQIPWPKTTTAYRLPSCTDVISIFGNCCLSSSYSAIFSAEYRKSSLRNWRPSMSHKTKARPRPQVSRPRPSPGQCDFRFDLLFSFSFVLVLQYFFVLVLVLLTTK